MAAADAVEVTAMETAVADLWLVGALCAGLLLAVPGSGARPLVRAAATAAVVAVALFGGLVAVLMARPDQMITVTTRIARRVPLLRAASLERLLRSVIARVRLVLASPEERRRIALWGLGNWLLDAVCLYLCVAAMGRAPDVGGLLTTYALVELIAMLPITPGGLGVVEGVAVPLLVSFGVPDGRALLAVLAWRLFEYWLPIPLAVGAYLWLRTRGVVQPPSGRRSRGGGSGATAGDLARRLR